MKNGIRTAVFLPVWGDLVYKATHKKRPTIIVSLFYIVRPQKQAQYENNPVLGVVCRIGNRFLIQDVQAIGNDLHGFQHLPAVDAQRW